MSLAQNSSKTIEQQFCRIASNMIVASDGIITVAVPVPDNIAIAVHTKLFLAAVEQCGEDISLTQGDDSLLVKSGEFEAPVPALPLTEVPQVFADAPAHIPSAELLQALDVAGELARTNSPKLAYSTILVDSGCATATDGGVIVQAWHGDFALPRMVVPAPFARLLGKAPAKPYRLGYTPESLTAWFEDGGWIKCQLYPADSKLPDYNAILNGGNGAVSIPLLPAVFEVAKKLKKTKSTEITYQHLKAVGNNGMSIETAPVMPINSHFEIGDLLTIESWAKTVQWGTMVEAGKPVVSFLFGHMGNVSIRGAIAHSWRY